MNPHDVWQGTFNFDKAPHTHDLEMSHRQAVNAMTKYFDCHCNVFTYESFLQIMSDLQTLSLSPFKIEAHRTNEKPFNDFLCILKKG